MPSGNPLGLHGRTVIRRPVTALDYAWAERTRPGGDIIVPIATGYHPPVRLMLTVHADRTASGRFAALPPRIDFPGPECPCGLGPTGDAAAVTGLLLPDVHKFVLHSGDPDSHALWLTEPAGSWAEVTRPSGIAPKIAQGGSRRLWDEVMEAWRRWDALGRPRLHQLGVTITPTSQWVWLGSSCFPVAMLG